MREGGSEWVGGWVSERRERGREGERESGKEGERREEGSGKRMSCVWCSHSCAGTMKTWSWRMLCTLPS